MKFNGFKMATLDDKKMSKKDNNPVTKKDFQVFREANKKDFDELKNSTKKDVNDLGGSFVDLRGEFDGLRGEFDGLRGEFDGLRGEFDGLRGEFDGLRGEFRDLRVEVKSEIGALRREMYEKMATKEDLHMHVMILSDKIDEVIAKMLTKEEHQRSMELLDAYAMELKAARDERILWERQHLRMDDTVQDHERRIRVLEVKR